MAVFPGGYDEKEDIVDDDVILFSDSENASAIVYVSMASLINKIFADGLLTLDEANSRVGIGTTSPATTLVVNGSISGKVTTITAGTYNDYDVTGLNTISCNTISGDITINGLSNGVASQTVTFIKPLGANNLIFNNNNVLGDEVMRTRDATDQTETGNGRYSATYSSVGWHLDV